MNDAKIGKDEYRSKYLDLLNEYYVTLNAYNYKSDTWTEIFTKYRQTKTDIINLNSDIKEDYDLKLNSYIEFVKSQETFHNDKLTSREVFFKSLGRVLERIGKTTSTAWQKIKFIFSTLAVSFASYVFTFIISMLFGTILYMIAPKAYNENYEGIVEAFLAMIIYFALKFTIFKDVYLRDYKTNTKVYIAKQVVSMLMFAPLFLFLKASDAYAINDMFTAQLMLFEPFLFVSGLNHEFFITPLVTYIIINALIIVTMVLYYHFMEKKYTLLKFKNENNISDNNSIASIFKKNVNLNLESDYNYHFDPFKEYPYPEPKQELRDKIGLKKILSFFKSNWFFIFQFIIFQFNILSFTVFRFFDMMTSISSTDAIIKICMTNHDILGMIFLSLSIILTIVNLFCLVSIIINKKYSKLCVYLNLSNIVLYIIIIGALAVNYYTYVIISDYKIVLLLFFNLIFFILNIMNLYNLYKYHKHKQSFNN